MNPAGFSNNYLAKNNATFITIALYCKVLFMPPYSYKLNTTQRCLLKMIRYYCSLSELQISRRM